MEGFNTLFQWFTEYAKTNPVIGGLVGLFGMSVVSFALVKCPRRIWAFVKHQFTTSVTFTNEERGYSNENFNAFMEWFQKNHFSALIRDYALDSNYGKRMQLAVGQGTHLFFWKGRPCWLRRERLDKQGTYVIFYSVTLTVLGRSRKPIMEMIDTFQYRPDKEHLGVYQLDNDDWTRVASIEKRSLDSVIVEPAVTELLTSTIDHFRSNRAWYIDRGFPYKLTILLHGVAGTGKTSLIKAMASHYGYNLCLLNLSTMSDSGLQKVLASAPSDSIIAIEDFDSTKAVHRRKIVKKLDGAPVGAKSSTYNGTAPATLKPLRRRSDFDNEEEVGPGSFSFLTLSGVLNALQGLLPLEDKILFLSTNHIELMDEALIRKGRVDKILEIKPMGDAEIRRYVGMLFPELSERLKTDKRPFKAQPGCDVQALYYEYRNDPEGFLRTLPRALALVEESSKAAGP